MVKIRSLLSVMRDTDIVRVATHYLLQWLHSTVAPPPKSPVIAITARPERRRGLRKLASKSHGLKEAVPA